jgi:hypothetical protein
MTVKKLVRDLRFAIPEPLPETAINEPFTLEAVAQINMGQRAAINFWTLDRALSFFRSITQPFQKAGWLVSLYGSVLIQGHGRDLDLIAVPWRPDANVMEAVDIIRNLYGATIEDDKEGIMGRSAIALKLMDESVVDIQFRPASILCPVCQSFRF